MIIMNAANEIAVEKFIEGKITYLGIGSLIKETLSVCTFSEPDSVEAVLEIDKAVRIAANEIVNKGI